MPIKYTEDELFEMLMEILDHCENNARDIPKIHEKYCKKKSPTIAQQIINKKG